MAHAVEAQPPRSEYLFKCFRCGRTHTANLTRRKFLSYRPKCPCGFTPRRYIPAGLTSGIATAATNAKSKFDNMYPYESTRLPKEMPNCPHAPNGNTVITDPHHEREIFAGRGNGDKYGRE